MAFELILQCEFVAGAGVELDVVVSCYGLVFAVCGEGVVRNWVVEEVVDFGWGHGRWEEADRSSSLLSPRR